MSEENRSHLPPWVVEHFSNPPRIESQPKLLDDAIGANRKYRSKDVFGESFFIKASDGWADDDYRCVRDMNQREELFSLLAIILKIPAIETWCVNNSGIVAETELKRWKLNVIPDRLTVSRWVDMPRLKNVCPHCDNELPGVLVDVLWNIFAFCLWIGHDDLGVEDLLWQNDLPVLIDFSLAGPPSRRGFLLTACRGTHFFRDDDEIYPRDQIIKMCPAKKPSLVAHIFRKHSTRVPTYSPVAIENIRGLSDRVLFELVERCGLNKAVAYGLCARRETLVLDFDFWRDEVKKLFNLNWKD